MELKTYAVHFCGIGGACAGMHKAGLDCKLAIDWWDKAIEYREKNLGHKGFHMDISEYEPKEEHAADILWTSPPCQTFSSSARETAVFKREDRRNNLFLNSLMYVQHFKPSFFVLENVPGLLTHDNGETIYKMTDAFKKAGYYCETTTMTSEEWGLPQIRERVFIIGCLKSLGFKGLFPKPPKNLTKKFFSDIREWHREDLAWGESTYVTASKKLERCGIEVEHVGETPEAAKILPTITCGWGGGATRKKVCVLDKTPSGTTFVRHPSVLEGARAQGFPDTWVYPPSETDAWQAIGNAVSLDVSYAIIEHLKKVARGEKPACLSVKDMKNRMTTESHSVATDGKTPLLMDLFAKTVPAPAEEKALQVHG